MTRQITSIFVGFLDADTTVEDIKQYVLSLTNQNPQNVENLITRNERLKLGLYEYSSFKITIMKSLKEKLLDPEVWPTDVVFREWREPRVNNAETRHQHDNHG